MTALPPRSADLNTLARTTDAAAPITTGEEKDPSRLVATDPSLVPTPPSTPRTIALGETTPGASTSISTSISADNRRAVDVYWPDPSPLQAWWTEVMEGTLMPRPLAAA